MADSFRVTFTAILIQMDNDEGLTNYVVSYASRKLLPRERTAYNWSGTDDNRVWFDEI